MWINAFFSYSLYRTGIFPKSYIRSLESRGNDSKVEEEEFLFNFQNASFNVPLIDETLTLPTDPLLIMNRFDGVRALTSVPLNANSILEGRVTLMGVAATDRLIGIV